MQTRAMAVAVAQAEEEAAAAEVMAETSASGRISVPPEDLDQALP